MIWNAFLLAIRQIWRNPLRSLLTVLGVVIGVAAVITMVTIGNGASTAIKTEIESFGNNQLMLRPGMRLGPGQKVGAPNFRLDDVTALCTQLAGIEAVAPQVSKSMTVVANGRNWQTSVVGTNTDYFTIDNRTFEDGRNFEEAEERAGSAVCVIGSTVANELFGTTQKCCWPADSNRRLLLPRDRIAKDQGNGCHGGRSGRSARYAAEVSAASHSR